MTVSDIKEGAVKVFVTGASGWIGSAVVSQLASAGHRVIGLARSDASAASIEGLGATAVRGDVGDLAFLRSAASAADGVIHLAFGHDFSDFAGAAREEAAAVEALGEALEGSDRPLVIASGTPMVPGRPSTERDPATAQGPAGARAAGAAAALACTNRGVRSSVVRLPRSVHGEGDRHGFITQLVAADRRIGASAYVGDGSQRWPAVHVADAAALFVAALERGAPGSVFHAVGDEGVSVLDIAVAIGEAVGLSPRAVPPADLGFLGAVLAVDQPASSALTREQLGWNPSGPSLLEDVRAGHYSS